MQVTRQSRRKTMRAQATPQQRKNVQPMNRMQASPIVKKESTIPEFGATDAQY